MNNTAHVFGIYPTRNSVVEEHRQLITAMREIERTIETLLAQSVLSGESWKKNATPNIGRLSR